MTGLFFYDLDLMKRKQPDIHTGTQLNTAAGSTKPYPLSFSLSLKSHWSVEGIKRETSEVRLHSVYKINKSTPRGNDSNTNRALGINRPLLERTITVYIALSLYTHTHTCVAALNCDSLKKGLYFLSSETAPNKEQNSDLVSKATWLHQNVRDTHTAQNLVLCSPQNWIENAF